MINLKRPALLSACVTALAAPRIARADAFKLRLTAISQLSAGSDRAAISASGKLFEQNGGIWQHSPAPRFTTDVMNKLRPQIMSATHGRRLR